ncbi:MAG: cation transporter [Acidobacteria bacterium]|nr:cation transporter [Acidobacteriota bacterium]
MVSAQRAAITSVLASLLLAGANVAVGLATQSRSVVALGVEFAGDVLASTAVLLGLWLAARPPDANHPYGHGRVETLAGLLVGFVLVTGGIGIAYRSLASGESRHAPGAAATAIVLVTIGVRAATAALKFRVGRRVESTSLMADAWNDSVDILSASGALVAVGLARFDPARFAWADRYGAAFVGLVVVVTGLRVVRQASLDLADTMPTLERTASLRRVACSVPGVLGVEKHYARKTGLQYHVDLHVEVSPEMTVRASHQIAHQVQQRVRAELPWVADVLVHIEPAPDAGTSAVSDPR